MIILVLLRIVNRDITNLYQDLSMEVVSLSTREFRHRVYWWSLHQILEFVIPLQNSEQNNLWVQYMYYASTSCTSHIFQTGTVSGMVYTKDESL